MQTVRMSSKNQIVIPKEAREAMHLRGRDELLVIVKGEVTVIMRKPESNCKALAGAGRGLYGETYLNNEQNSW